MNAAIQHKVRKRPQINVWKKATFELDSNWTRDSNLALNDSSLSRVWNQLQERTYLFVETNIDHTSNKIVSLQQQGIRTVFSQTRLLEPVTYKNW